MKRFLLLLLVVLLGWVGMNGKHLGFPDVVSAYTAKEYCSCRYVMNNDAGYCRGYVKQWLQPAVLMIHRAKPSP